MRVISTFKSACDQYAEALQVSSYNERQSQTAARNPWNVDWDENAKRGGFSRSFSVPLSLQPLHGYLLEAKCHIHGASGFRCMNSCDWLCVQISISLSFCLLVAHTSHRAFFSPQLWLLWGFFFFLFFSDLFMLPHVPDASALSGVYRRLCLRSILLSTLEWIIASIWPLHEIVPMHFSYCSR